MITSELSKYIKNKSHKLGFEACGIAKAALIPEPEIAHFRSWIEKDFHAEMHYMEKNSEIRYNPGLLVKDCRSIIVVAMNYEPEQKQDSNVPKIARFAYGKDYHGIVREKLRSLLHLINEQGEAVHGRAFSDSAPVAERYWALQSGIGWIGKNHHLIIPQKGSHFILGELMVDKELDYDCPQTNRCGQCRRCIDSCPTHTLTADSGLDTRRCLSYLTIEKRGIFNPVEASMIRNNEWLFGCDVCQDACPWNRFSRVSNIPELQAKPEFIGMNKDDYNNMTEKDFYRIFRGTCLERIGYEGFIRNYTTIKSPAID